MAKRESMRGRGAAALFSPQPTADGAADHDASEPVRHHASTPALHPVTESTTELVKATFYLTPDLVLKLEQVRLSRKRRGEKIDKSALVREAIGLLAEED